MSSAKVYKIMTNMINKEVIYKNKTYDVKFRHHICENDIYSIYNCILIEVSCDSIKKEFSIDRFDNNYLTYAKDYKFAIENSVKDFVYYFENILMQSNKMMNMINAVKDWDGKIY